MAGRFWLTLGLVAVVFIACGEDTRRKKKRNDDDDGVGGMGGAAATVGPGTGGATTGVETTTVATTSDAATTSTGGLGLGAVCDTGLSYGPGFEVFDGCLDDKCCESFVPCTANNACAACLDNPSLASCSSNALYQSFLTCQNNNCALELCGLGIGYPSPTLNACVNTSTCCNALINCDANATCSACLGNSGGAGCSTNALFNAFTSCRDAACPSNICGAPIAYNDNYANGTKDVDYSLNFCASQYCCSQMHACADPSSNGYPADPSISDPESEACLLCLIGDPGCNPAVAPYATAFLNCVASNC